MMWTFTVLSMESAEMCNHLYTSLGWTHPFQQTTMQNSCLQFKLLSFRIAHLSIAWEVITPTGVSFREGFLKISFL